MKKKSGAVGTGIIHGGLAAPGQLLLFSDAHSLRCFGKSSPVGCSFSASPSVDMLASAGSFVLCAQASVCATAQVRGGTFVSRPGRAALN